MVTALTRQQRKRKSIELKGLHGTRVRKTLAIPRPTNSEKENKPITCFEGNTDGYLEFVVEHGVEHRRSIVEHVFGEEQATTTTRKPMNQFSVLEILPSSISEKSKQKVLKVVVDTLERIAWYRKEEASEKGLLLNAT
ncbi:hypothetical protein Tco_0322755 [Tanacetum coccineum]